MRLVDADEMERHAYNDLHYNAELEDWEFDMLTHYLDLAPTIDAVPVVRCKDCALQGKLNCPMDEWVKTDGNGFCHHGKRKDDDG